MVNNKIIILMFLLWFGMAIFLTVGCTSIPIPSHKKCQATNLAGPTWASNDLSTLLTFNDDCSGVVQMCQKYFTYEMTDYGTVYITVDTTSVVGAYGSKVNRDCPNKQGVYKCTYSITHLTESNMEVMDINCAWNNKTEQVKRYEKEI